MNEPVLDLPGALPEAPEAEQAILGIILLDATILGIARDLVADGDFALVRHQRIYRAMLDLADKGAPIDNLTLTDGLRQKGELADIGGAAYLAELLGVVASSANIKSY